ncbi:ABC transporter ATP-binding protein [Brachyspira pilosicoli]|uniref:ATP-binding cassette domain-containing protein n=1 Tax=Brachyspira pilosicoli TaxID=52584 RepID=A0AAJ6KEK7_BRAPL|nr:ATP-binding cassette domain-containing protein [Brachyspira pilosicoli]MBW5377052.1 ATP-binding cassette domain-containing protein [Brachyspira pilosicoli]MBW5382862.1 ATP-binding cassette domain-containing protein [Brachyspira pilosicoli]WIH82159.1 ATP-binding cassette domain-containing protein [Brachyspira pilosicoli]WIH83820.1 ATP-binding cassette domain-containing protein [Brachyspira pilosicoli]WIH88869.1 ATP-binding cassette domain-containing protein [Brachyspira pilosicoli]
MISVKNLTKYYDDFQALKGISFEIKSGEIVGILGPNGAGKSTTLRILTSYLSPTSGDAIIDGKSILDKDIEIKKIIGYLPESAPLYNDMCVFDYLVYMADIQELDRNKLSERLNYVVEACSLKDVISKPIGELSKGYKQRVGLAGAIIHDPKILILDEPTNGLDPNQIVEIRELIKELGKEKTVLISTHILSEVEATCSRAIIINKGTIIADNDPKHLTVDNKISSIKLSLKTNDSFETIKTKLNSLDNIQDITLVEEDNNIKTIIVKTTDKEPIEKVYKFIKNTDWIIYEFVKEKENLETVFHTLTKGEN